MTHGHHPSQICGSGALAPPPKHCSQLPGVHISYRLNVSRLLISQAASGANVTVWSTPQWVNELDTALEVTAMLSRRNANLLAT